MIDFPPLPSHVDSDVAEAIRAAFTARAFSIAHEIATEYGWDRHCLLCGQQAFTGRLASRARLHVCGGCRITAGHCPEIAAYDLWWRWSGNDQAWRMRTWVDSLP